MRKRVRLNCAALHFGIGIAIRRDSVKLGPPKQGMDLDFSKVY